ncbi:MAG: hypothetical protein EOM59_17210 [Clostridia bacterium]|nr:hypothetical protein [Clostridia bacterium]
MACPEGEYSPLGKECKACTTGLLNVSKTTCTYCSRYQYHKIETGNTSSTCDSCLNWCESLQFKTDYPSTTYPTDSQDAITYCKKRAYVQTELTYILGGVDYGTYNKCALCDRGEVANPNTNACIPVFCEGGQFVNDAAECEWCESDEFTTGQQSECFSCTNYGFNHAFNDSRTACTLCTGRTEPTKISAVLWASLGKDPNDYDTYAHLTCQDIFENTPTDSESCQEMGYRWYVSDEYFTDEHCVNNQNQQVKLYQIRSCAGQVGGLIQKAANLSKDSWIGEKATVCGVQALDGTWADARVEGNSNITPDDYLVIKRNTVKETDLLGDVTLNETVTNSIHLTGSSATHNTIDGIKPIVINDGFTMTGGTLKGGTFSGGVVSGGTIGQATMTGGNVGGDAKIGLTGTGAPDTTSSIVISAGTINGGNINGAVNITGGTISGGTIKGTVQISGGNILEATTIDGTVTIKGGQIRGNSIVTGGTIESGYITGDAKMGGGTFKTYALFGHAEFYGGTLEQNLGDYVRLCWDANNNRRDTSCTAKITSGVSISGNAQVWGDAKLLGGTVLGNARIFSGTIEGGTIKDAAKVGGGIFISRTLSGHAEFYGGTLEKDIGDYVKLCWDADNNRRDTSCTAKISSGVSISGNVQVWGNANLEKGTFSENAKIKGGTFTSYSGTANSSYGYRSYWRTSWGGDPYSIQNATATCSKSFSCNLPVVKGNAKVNGGTIRSGILSGNVVVNSGDIRCGYTRSETQTYYRNWKTCAGFACLSGYQNYEQTYVCSINAIPGCEISSGTISETYCCGGSCF